MPVLKDLEKTVAKISEWQESCAELQHGLRILLGENVSIADVAVTKDGFAPKKKKGEIDEAEMAGDIKDKDRSGRDVVITPDGKTKRLTPQQSREMQRNGDGDEDEDGEDNTRRATLTKIRKTQDILQSDQRLREFIVKYFEFRMTGNFGRADEIKLIIQDIIDSRELDSETVFASYDLGLGIGPDTKDTEEEPEPKEDPEEEEDKDNDSETEKE